MTRGAIGFALGILIGLALGWFAHPKVLSGSTGPLPVSSSDQLPSRSAKQPFENTRATFARLLAQRAQVSSEEPPLHDSPMLLGALETVASVDPIGAARMVIRAGLDEHNETELLRAIARLWFRRDGPSILGALVREGAYEELRPFYHPVFSSVANELPFEALDPIMSLEDAKLRNHLFFNIIFGIRPEDVPRVAQALMELPVKDRQYIVRNMASELASRSPEFTLDWAGSLTSAESAELRQFSMQALAGTDPLRVIELMETGGVEDAAGIAMHALEGLARTDPLGAVSAYERLGDVAEKDRIASGIVRGWADSDPAAAASWLASLGTSGASEALESLARRWAEQDIDAAAAFTSQLPERDRRAWMGVIAASLRYAQPERYLQWIEQFRAEPFYLEMLSAAVWPLERDDPEAAVAFVLRLDPSVRSEPLRHLIEQFARHDPERAAGWLIQIPDEDIRSTSTVQLVRSWVYNAPDQTLQWIETLPAGTVKDDALAAVVAYGQSSVMRSFSRDISNRDTRMVALLSGVMPMDSARTLVALFAEASLDERHWTTLESALTRAPP